MITAISIPIKPVVLFWNYSGDQDISKSTLKSTYSNTTHSSEICNCFSMEISLQFKSFTLDQNMLERISYGENYT